MVINGKSQSKFPSKLVVRTCPGRPAVVLPVPPFATGSAVPERVIANVPEVVIGEPDIERNAGTEAATEVTEPPESVVHEVWPAPFVVSTYER